MPSTPAFQPAITRILVLNTHSGRTDIRGIEAYARRLDAQAQRARARGDEAGEQRLRHLAYVHRAAAVQAREAKRNNRRRWRKAP